MHTVLMLTLQQIARAVTGDVCVGQVLGPGPGHSPKDRSLSIKLDARAPDGFLVHSFAGDDPIVCKDYVRGKLGLPVWNGRADKPLKVLAKSRKTETKVDEAKRSKSALKIWQSTKPADGTVVETYLRSRDLHLPLPPTIRFCPS